MGRNLFTWNLSREDFTNKVYCRYLGKNSFPMEISILDSSIKDSFMGMAYLSHLNKWSGFLEDFIKDNSVRFRNLTISKPLRKSTKLGFKIWGFCIGGFERDGSMLRSHSLRKSTFIRNYKMLSNFRWLISIRITKKLRRTKFLNFLEYSNSFKAKGLGVWSTQRSKDNWIIITEVSLLLQIQ